MGSSVHLNFNQRSKVPDRRLHKPCKLVRSNLACLVLGQRSLLRPAWLALDHLPAVRSRSSPACSHLAHPLERPSRHRRYKVASVLIHQHPLAQRSV
ncbi:hypothetical protein PHSY_006259 [Pseudozyma hubeiensis SY62]|uniref:Uncharacterized protein n=1 Tax=Pseudozyma hubeiensis (strain SY62) TaxID=1305764 RepID=R9PKL8_PSEHS|nr:hypothetical protein PHSY_006259 [Pseudozyma hubeiensis SY62]GAC98665.1 hypothetical protein PHSY_006259 [Pseudozyma hubeiensis SY62]